MAKLTKSGKHSVVNMPTVRNTPAQPVKGK